MIDVYVDNIKCSLSSKCYFSALALALVLPDICGTAEFPDKATVAERYIEWYEKYIGFGMEQGKGGNNPWLSGELVYNLRNTFLHQGSPNVIGSKIKNETNQLDRFVLILGDGTQGVCSVNIELGNEITFKCIIVDVAYLCNRICDCALWYYHNNREKFQFHFNVVTQEAYENPSRESLEGDVFAKVLNQKLERIGSKKRVIEKYNTIEQIKDTVSMIFSNEEIKERFLSGGIVTIPYPLECKEDNKVIKNISKGNRDEQVYSFLNQYFKTYEELLSIGKKEEIIQSVLNAKTKQQINNNLQKYFSNEEVRKIYRGVKPLIKDMDGK